VINAVPREAWFTVDLRSLDSETQDRLESAVVSTARRIGEQERVGFRMERQMGIDYSKARPQQERRDHPLVQTALAATNYFRKPGTPAVAAADVGSCDSNIAVSMGIPAVAIGATLEYQPHRLEEYAEASSIVPGIKKLIALGVALTSH
jgi:acetylornithine deacetylase/succinyl-diaminopimelate desuccinylase-like protein